MKNLVGKKFNLLTVIGQRTEPGYKYICECVCDCGNKVDVFKNNLINGHTKSCGCLNSKLSKERMTKGPNKIIKYTTFIKILLDDDDFEKYCIIDAEDYELIKDYRWYLTSNNYAATRKTCGGELLLMHRIIMGNKNKDKVIDHINGKTLDNRKKNLRVCEQCQNSYNSTKYKNNTSGFKGVSKDKKRNKWVAQTRKEKQKITSFWNTKEEAAEAYDIAALKLFGEFARLNFEEKRQEYLNKLSQKHNS